MSEIRFMRGQSVQLNELALNSPDFDTDRICAGPYTVKGVTEVPTKCNCRVRAGYLLHHEASCDSQLAELVGHSQWVTVLCQDQAQEHVLSGVYLEPA